MADVCWFRVFGHELNGFDLTVISVLGIEHLDEAVLSKVVFSSNTFARVSSSLGSPRVLVPSAEVSLPIEGGRLYSNRADLVAMEQSRLRRQ